MEWHSIFRLGFILLFYQTHWIFKIFVSGLEENELKTSSPKTEIIVNKEQYVYYQGVQGRPGIDFPIFTRIPRTAFSCRDVESGYYADLETNCQVFHICNEGLKVSFLCPNGTIFRQTDLICDWWFKVNCPKSPDFYQESAEQLRIDSARKKTSRKVQHHGDITFTSKEIADKENNVNQFTDRKFDVNSHNRERARANRARNRVPQYDQEETQVTQESSYYNSLRQHVNSQYPNHKKTYSEIQNPTNFYTNLPNRNKYTNSSYSPQTIASTNQYAINNGQPFVVSTQKYTPVTITRQSTDFLVTTPYITVKSTTTPYKYIQETTTIPPNTNSFRVNSKYVTPKPIDKTTKGKYSIGLNSNQGQVSLKVSSNPVSSSNNNKAVKNQYVPRNRATYTENKIVRKGYSVDVSNDFKKVVSSSTTLRPITTVDTRRAKALDGNYNFYKNNNFETTYYNNGNSITTEFPQYVYSTNPLEITRPKPFRLPTQPPEAATTVTPLDIGFTISNDLPQYQISSAAPFANSGKTLYPVEVTTGYFDPTLPTVSYKTNNLHDMINTLRQIVNNKTETHESISNEEVPPSVGPQTLHSLAVYFANALETKANDTANHLEADNNATSLFTLKTMQDYKELFQGDTEEIMTTMKAITKLMEQDDNDNDLDVQHSLNLVQSPRVRELAKVFSQALSSYLDNPDMFRRVLQEIRPTEPPTKSKEQLLPAEEDELLNFSDVDGRYPIIPTSTPYTPTWGYILATDKKPEEYPTFDDSNKIGTEVENLQGADSSSLVSQLNQLAERDIKKLHPKVRFPDKPNSEELLPNHWTSSPDATKLWQSTLYVNPLSVNERLQNSESTETTSGETVQSGGSSEDSTYDESMGDASLSQGSVELQYDLRALPDLTLNASQVHGILIDFMNSTSNKLQMILNKFNTTENEFLDKMKEIENNPLTRRLILLLINECGGTSQEKRIKESAVDDIIQLAQDEDVPREEKRRKKENTVAAINKKREEEDQDSRALQLLNSLYTIASKYGK